jgi:hypothetical protein
VRRQQNTKCDGGWSNRAVAIRIPSLSTHMCWSAWRCFSLQPAVCFCGLATGENWSPLKPTAGLNGAPSTFSCTYTIAGSGECYEHHSGICSAKTAAGLIGPSRSGFLIVPPQLFPAHAQRPVGENRYELHSVIRSAMKASGLPAPLPSGFHVGTLHFFLHVDQRPVRENR